MYNLKPSQYDEGYNMNAVLSESSKTAFLKLGVHYDDLYKSSALINLTKKTQIEIGFQRIGTSAI